MPGQESSSYRERNSTADRTLDVLSLFNDDHPVVGGVEVAKQLQVARSTAYRYLQSLVSARFLEEEPTGGYRLGMRFVELGRLARRAHDLSDIAAPVIVDLAARAGETALITRRAGNLVVCLDRAESETHRLRISYERGAVLPINAGASALVLLAWDEPDSIRQTFAQSHLQQFTPATLIDVDQLMDRLERIKRDGYAVTRAEVDDDVVGIAAPIFTGEKVTAAVTVAALASRVPKALERRILTQVREAAETISRQLTIVAG
ncbi:IclR family transcriptional regulator [Amycolatopsis sp. DSM 110486]|nr:IclR family transcriptional regulator [Amycolatopsis sp. DSM 110486]